MEYVAIFWIGYVVGAMVTEWQRRRAFEGKP